MQQETHRARPTVAVAEATVPILKASKVEGALLGRVALPLGDRGIVVLEGDLATVHVIAG